MSPASELLIFYFKIANPTLITFFRLSMCILRVRVIGVWVRVIGVWSTGNPNFESNFESKG